jgi:putative addiction module CopG family antidote
MGMVNISLPDHLEKFAEQRIAAGRYSDISEYVRELIEADKREAEREVVTIIDPAYYHLLTDEQWRKEEDKLEALLLEAMEEEPVEADDKFWTDFRERAKARSEARKKGAANSESEIHPQSARDHDVPCTCFPMIPTSDSGRV